MGELEILKQRVEDLTGDLSRMDKLLTVTAHQRNQAQVKLKQTRCVLLRLVEKVERANAIQHSGTTIPAEDWAELYALTNDARGRLEDT